MGSRNGFGAFFDSWSVCFRRVSKSDVGDPREAPGGRLARHDEDQAKTDDVYCAGLFNSCYVVFFDLRFGRGAILNGCMLLTMGCRGKVSKCGELFVNHLCLLIFLIIILRFV